MLIREKLTHPVTVVGYSLGGDAALLATEDSQEIDRIIAVRPYLSTMRLQDILKERHDLYWLPFFRTVMWFWYEIRSSYAPEYRELDDVSAAEVPTVLFIPADKMEDEEVLRFQELSDPNVAEVKPIDSSVVDLTPMILELLIER